MPKKKSLRDRFEEFLDELDDDDDAPRGRRRDRDDDDDVITLRGPAARKMLGLLDDEKKPDGEKPDGDDGDGKKPDDDTPKRGKGYFKDNDKS